MVLLGIHCDKWPDALKAAKKHGIDYPITNAVAQISPKAYAIDGYPTVFVIDRKGIVRFVDPENLEASVRMLIKEKPSK